jgi:hypothetical protein
VGYSLTVHDSDEKAHAAMPFPVGEVLTWRAAVDLVRRHPGELWIVQTYPFDFYDCLSVRPLGAAKIAPGIDFNRFGTSVRVSWFGTEGSGPNEPPILRWDEAFADDDRLDWIRHVEDLAGLDSPTKTPASTPSSLALRWISAFMAQQFGSRRRWRAHNTWYDGPAQRYLPNHPAAARFAEQFGENGSAHVWLLQSEDDTLSAAVCADGTLHIPGRDRVELLPLYRKGGSSLLRLLAATAADLLE